MNEIRHRRGGQPLAFGRLLKANTFAKACTTRGVLPLSRITGARQNSPSPAHQGPSPRPSPHRMERGRSVRFLGILNLLLLCSAFSLRAALQFDAFLGYDGIVPQASWFPVVCEIKNDGPPFKATVELTGSTLNQGQSIRMPVELPTGTLKRIVLPIFSSSRGYTSWDVKLLDERGRTRSEQIGMRPRKQVARGTAIIGAITRTAGGTPTVRPILPNASELQPTGARLLPSIFPDNPLVLEGMSSLYLNSERAAELSVNQVNAIMMWLHEGGHLIIGLEQPSDITASPWLKTLFPCEVKDLKTIANHGELHDWLRNTVGRTNAVSTDPNMPQVNFNNRYGMPVRRSGPPPESGLANPFRDLAPDPDFEKAPIQVASGTVREGVIDVAAGDTPLIVTTHRGRGLVTALLFSPEREPVRSWKHLPTLWARLIDVPAYLYVSANANYQGGYSSDGVFGAMIDTRQVHKLPVEWLLLLLIVYLVVIGPLDQFWLKRIGKPMLTWITFPCYVVLFSLIIYFIGYKLRAGESEWNELHVVDILPKSDHSELRGRTYSSVYSPANQKYLLESQEKYATLRSEFAGLWGGGQSSERATVVQNGDTFKAEIFVPVWTSELFVSDWWQPAPTPLAVTITPQGGGWQVHLANQTDHKFANVQLVIEDRIINLGEMPSEQTKTMNVTRDQGTLLRSFVDVQSRTFQGAATSRQRALGYSESGQIDDKANASMAVSFLEELSSQEAGNFISPPGLDMSQALTSSQAVLLAWEPDFSPAKPMYRFTPKRSHKDTLWRMVVPLTPGK
jgi:hypothetical protein